MKTDNRFLISAPKLNPHPGPHAAHLFIGGRKLLLIGVLLVGNIAVRVFASDGDVDPTFIPGKGLGGPGSLALQSDGKILMAGGNGISRLNADGSGDTTFNPGTGTNDRVRAVAVQADGKIVIVGEFSSYNGVPQNKIARLDPNGSLDTAFNAGSAGINNGLGSNLQCVAVQPDGKLIIGGPFTTYNGVARRGVARLNTDGSLDTTFDVPSGTSTTVYRLALQSDGKILITGSVNQTIARLNADGSPDTTFDAGTGVDAQVDQIAIDIDGKIVVGGWFTKYNGVSRNGVARLHSNGSLDLAFDPGTGADGFVYSSPLQSDGKIILSGTFSHYNGIARQGLARINLDGSLDPTFIPKGPASFLLFASLVQPDGNVVSGGLFQTYDGASRPGLVRILAAPKPRPLFITSPLTTAAMAGQQFTYQIVTSLPATSYSATNVPAGLSFDGNLGVITGVPTAAGTFNIALGAANSSSSDSKTLNLTIAPAPPANSATITSGTSATARTSQSFQFQITASGVTSGATVTASGLPAGLSLDSDTGLISGTPPIDGSFLVNLTLTDGSANATRSLQLTFTSDPVFPVISSPSSMSLTRGQPVSYQILTSASSTETTTYSLSETLPAGLTFNSTTGVISGSYSPALRRRDKEGKVEQLKTPSGEVIANVQLFAHNSHGTATAQLIFLTPLPAAAVNISTRAIVSAGDNVLIGGFIVTGKAAKKVIIRAVGPSLAVNGVPVPGTVQDPTLELRDSTNALLATNDDWRVSQEQAIKDSTVPPADDRESAIVATLQPGNYTAIVAGKGTASGIALVELYDLDPANNARLAQISTRGNVLTNDNVLIGGFIIVGNGSANVLVRGIGPELTASNVPNVLQNPTLELRGANGAVLAANDDWETDQRQAITDTTVPPKDSREPAILESLPPGNYTAIVRGKDNSVGVALVEVYVIE